MDDKGFIFTTDATLALVIFMVFSTSFITYYALPGYMGEDHEHLERIAADALRIMRQDGTLYNASVQYANGNVTGAQNTLNSNLSYLIPSDIGYRITLKDYPSVEDSRGLLYSNNVVTRVDVISGPREGWMGRAWYKVEKAEFVDQPTNVTTTLWNFHNWLTNFNPWEVTTPDPWWWGTRRWYGGLYQQPYWGRGTSPQNIQFSVPEGATIHSAEYLIGSTNRSGGTSYSANLTLNGVNNQAKWNNFTFLNNRPGTNEKMYNFHGNVSGLKTGLNNYTVRFWDMFTNGDIYDRNDRYRYDMAWFSIIGNYTTTFKVPQGVLNSRFDFNDTAGLAVPNAQDLGDGTLAFGRIFDLNSGTVSSFYNNRTMSWSTFVDNRNTLDTFDDGIPFVITDLPNIGGTRHGSAVSVIQEFNITDNVSPLDGYTVLNAYGAVDNALVEMWNGTQWRTVFCSFDFDGGTFSARGDGYGNIPGILYIGDRLNAGHNRIRVTVWDLVGSNDYDLVGLVDSYTHVTYTRLPIRWENFAYNNYQSSSNTNQLTRTFTTEANAREVYLFVGAGLDSRHLRVEVAPPGVGGGWQTLYDSNVIPFYLNLASLDTGGVFTNRSGGNYTIRPGVNYRTRVTVTGPSNNWESGDWNANAEIFSGTRISVLYPEFLENRWTASYASNSTVAKEQARQELIDVLIQSGITPDPNLIRDEALFTGDLPNSIPVRLELWKH
jgi:hypothetical protein